jgi:hypothetical protein
MSAEERSRDEICAALEADEEIQRQQVAAYG